MRLLFPPILSLLLLLVVSVSGDAQIKLFENGEIPTDHVYRIIQDKEGYIWILTEEGIVKYNGTETKIFTVKDGLPTNDVFNGLITDDNKFWFICKGNEMGYIYQDSVYSFRNPDGETFNSFGILQKSNSLTIKNTENTKKYELTNGKWNSTLLHYVDPESSTEILDYGSIYYSKTTKTKLTFFDKNHNPLFTFTSQEVPLRSGIKFFFTEKYMVILLASKAVFIEAITHKKTVIDLGKFGVTKIHANYMNGSFQLTGKDCVIQLNKNLEITSEFTFDPKYNAHANLIDKEGNLWLGSFTNGVYYMTKEAYLSELQSPEKDIKQAQLFQNELYYTDYQGISTFNSQAWFRDESRQFTTIASTDNKLIIGSYSANTDMSTQLMEFNSHLFTVLNTTPTGITRYKNNYYINLFNGIYIYDTNFAYQDLRKEHYNSVINFQDTLLYGNNNGLYYFWSGDQYQGFDKPTRVIKQNKNDLYIGTMGFGMVVFQNGKQHHYPLNDAIINDIQIVRDSLVFCSSNQGVICLVKRNDSLLPYYVYNKKDGMLSSHANSFHLDSGKNVYIATKKGVLKTKLILPSEVIKSNKSIRIEYIKWNNQKQTSEELEFTNEKRNNALNIKFSVIKFTQSTYSYKLNGEEYKTANNGELSLDNLAPGEYTISLKVETPFIEEQVRVIDFSIKSKWYNTSGFYMFLVFSVLIIIFFIFRHNRIKNHNKTIFKLQKQAELSDYKLNALRSQMNPHFVFNSLNSIQYYIGENKNELSERYLVKFSNLVRKFFELSTQKSISIRQEAALLDNYLEIEKMRFEDKLSYTVHVDPELDKSISIPTMILQPIVENSVNHGLFHKENEGLIEIFFKKISQKKTEVTITDDGVGIENSKSYKSSTLNNNLSKSTLIFRERIDLLNQSEAWRIDYTVTNLREDEKYPGTKTVLTIEHNRHESNTDR